MKKDKTISCEESNCSPKDFRKAAEQGEAKAYFNMGVCYQFGKGTRKNAKKAVECYRKAAELGLPDAMLNFGICCCIGEGVERDLKEGEKWLRKADELGCEDAKDALKQLEEAANPTEKEPASSKCKRGKKEIFEVVRDILVEQLGVEPEQVTLKASLTDDLEADSIDLAELVMVFESEVFQTGLPDEEVERLTTVGEIVDYIHRKL